MGVAWEVDGEHISPWFLEEIAAAPPTSSETPISTPITDGAAHIKQDYQVADDGHGRPMEMGNP